MYSVGREKRITLPVVVLHTDKDHNLAAGKIRIKEEPTEKEIQDQIRATLAKLSGGKSKTSGSKYRREKRQAYSDAQEQQMLQDQESSKTLKVAEFSTANDLASMMDVSVNEVISTCLGLGMFVSINQRLDAEAITVIADEFGYAVQFSSAEDELTIAEQADSEEELLPRAPIVTIMAMAIWGPGIVIDNFIAGTQPHRIVKGHWVVV